MSEIEINGLRYVFKLCDKEEMGNTENKGEIYLGYTNYIDQEVKILKGLKRDKLKRVVVHELTHCYIEAYLENQMLKNTFEDEDICCFVSAYANKILNDANYITFELQNSDYIMVN